MRLKRILAPLLVLSLLSGNIYAAEITENVSENVLVAEVEQQSEINIETPIDNKNEEPIIEDDNKVILSSEESAPSNSEDIVGKEGYVDIGEDNKKVPSDINDESIEASDDRMTSSTGNNEGDQKDSQDSPDGSSDTPERPAETEQTDKLDPIDNKDETHNKELDNNESEELNESEKREENKESDNQSDDGEDENKDDVNNIPDENNNEIKDETNVDSENETEKDEGKADSEMEEDIDNKGDKQDNTSDEASTNTDVGQEIGDNLSDIVEEETPLAPTVPPASNSTTVNTFSVTVPMSLPIYVDEYGEVHSSEVYIYNESTSDVAITDIDVKGKNDWKMIDYDNFSQSINTKEFAIEIWGNKSVDDGFAFDKEVMLRSGEESLIDYSAKISIQTSGIEEEICHIVFRFEALQNSNASINVNTENNNQSTVYEIEPDVKPVTPNDSIDNTESSGPVIPSVDQDETNNIDNTEDPSNKENESGESDLTENTIENNPDIIKDNNPVNEEEKESDISEIQINENASEVDFSDDSLDSDKEVLKNSEI